MIGFSTQPRILLSTLIQGLNLSKKCPRLSVKGLALDSRKVQPGYIFFALKGHEKDGMNYISQAIERGAVAVLIEWKNLDGSLVTYINEGAKFSVPIIGVEQLSQSVSFIAGRFYGDPAKTMSVVAVTGTNGKTTCAQLYADLSSQVNDLDTSLSDNHKSGFVGTLGHGIVGESIDLDSKLDLNSDEVLASPLTTPDAITMQKILADLQAAGCEAVAIEASSHALEQNRISSIAVDTAIFTNLSRDHLDYHGDLTSYANAKRKLFKMPGLKNAVVNIDDIVGKTIFSELDPNIRAISYSLENITADIYCQALDFSPIGFRALIHTPWGSGEIVSSLLGKFNLCNLLAVIGAFVIQADGSEYDNFTKVLKMIPALNSVSGRMELIGNGAGPAVIVDYAHTPDALEKALKTLHLHCKGSLWVVFGCGGDRDIGKRAEMGEIAKSNADSVVVTSDNPRTESPQKIIQDILAGSSKDVIVEVDRRKAINRAIGGAGEDDIVLIAGKGHENYQILGVERLPFSDQVEARLALRQVSSDDTFGGGL
jgi:UDP-N-acetylmuramoyl-L-alanyl-D-glutamate--2,6-diaminopimelate ligase